MSFQDMISNIERIGENIFLSSRDGSMTFTQFRNQVDLLKGYMYKTITDENITIGICIRSKSICSEVYIAAIEMGHDAAIIGFDVNQNELDQYVGSVPVSLVVCSRYDRDIPRFECDILYIEEMVLNTCTAIDFISRDIYGDTLVQTSGTSGKRKVVRLSVDNLLSSANSWGSAIELSAEDTYVHALDLSTVGGVAILWRSLLHGFAIYMTDSKLADFKKINSGNVIVSLVPTMLFDIIKDKGPGYFKGIDLIVLGGEPIGSRQVELISGLNINIFMAYGMTETSSGVMGRWIAPMSEDEYIPFRDVSAMVVSGRIYLHGPMISTHLVPGSISSNYLLTDDSGSIGPLGIRITGRSDRTIISGGKKINPLDIERKILEIVGVESVSVYPEDDDRWGQIVVASVVTHKKSGIDRELIDSHCRESLSAYKLPKKYYIKTIKEEN